MIGFPVPELTQHADQTAILNIADILYPGFMERDSETQELRMWVSGDQRTDDLAEAETRARNRFRKILGVLRAQKFGRGELQSEIERSATRDEFGNQVIRVGTLRIHPFSAGPLADLASRAATGVTKSPNLESALRILGKPNREAVDYNNIYELAEMEFGERNGIRQALGLSGNRQDEFTKSANQLAPSNGGRHAKGDPGQATMSLEDLSRFGSELVKAWINRY